MLEFMKTLWRRWKALAHRIIRGQNWLLMGVAYWVGMGPVAFFMRIKHEDLIDRGLGDASSASHWLPLAAPKHDIRRAQRPWSSSAQRGSKEPSDAAPTLARSPCR